MKKPGVQVLEDLLQIVVPALRAKQALASAHLPDQVGLGRDGRTASKFTEARSMLLVNPLAVKLGDQDVKDGMQHRLRRAFQQIGDSNQNPPLTQPDRVVQIGKREE